MKLNKMIEKSNESIKLISSGIRWVDWFNIIYLNPYFCINFHNFCIRIKLGTDKTDVKYYSLLK